MEAELSRKLAPLNSHVEADLREVSVAMLGWWTKMLLPKPTKLFSGIEAVSVPKILTPTDTRGVNVQDSFGVPEVKLQTVVSWPMIVLPIPALIFSRKF